MKKAVIIIPTYNERENISKLIPILLDIFKGISTWDMHILVVDDSSPDKTADVVREIIKKHPKVHLHLNAKKAGLGHAYIVGMEESFDRMNADLVFEMDADFQHDPYKVPEFLQAVDNGADLVVGSRYIKGGSIPSHWKLQRKFLSVVGNWVNMVVFTNFSIHDWTGGFRAIRKSVFEAVRDDIGEKRLSGYTFQIGFLHKVLRKGFKIVEVPFAFKDRTSGESKLGPDYIRNALLYIVTARYQEIVTSHIFKFGIVGGIGFVINAVALAVFTSKFGIEAGNASAMGAEIAIVSNFILNNFWTFSERQVNTPVALIKKFIQFNIASAGAVVIQKVVVTLGTSYTSDNLKFLWFVVAVAIGMVLNYVIYSKVIWKKK
ncbi:MAG: glycosyltransferase family 2 protein [Candidatus Woesebacteria bacterium]